MHILAFALMFVVGSLVAASEGDYSGIAAIGKFVGITAFLLGVLWLFTKPLILIIVMVVLFSIIVACYIKWR